MNARLKLVRSFPSLIPVFFLAVSTYGQSSLQSAQGDGLVMRALAAELRAAQDTQHPTRYMLRKSTPRLTTTKEIMETQDGAVARLISVNDKPLSQDDEQKERGRLDQLLSDPRKQRHRKQAEESDAARAHKLLRAMPNAFVYEFKGSADGPNGKLEKFKFRPNPKFDPPDLETQVLTAMTGEIWIDASEERVARLEGHLQQDADVGWGIVARVNKGGWIVIEQSDIGDHQWRIAHFQMQMAGRVLFWNKVFDTTQDQSQFAPVATGLSYKQAIEMLRAGRPETARISR